VPLSSASSPSDSLTFSTVVSRLRAAGCVFAEDEARLLLDAAPAPGELARMVDRRAAGLPLEHVLGWADFCGLRVAVEHGVFVPRRRTEFLVHRAAAGTPAGALVVDLCCGSGALGAALAAAVRQRGGGRVELHASDVDPAAVVCARRNVATAGGRVHEGDLYSALPASLRGRIDVLLANVPYVPSDEIALLPAEARLHEARVALDGGADGLDVLRRVAPEAASWLAPGGRLLFETSERQAGAAACVVRDAGLSPEVAVSDDLFATVVVATRGSAA
jgi:release factor glutamine methyltransferase